MYFRSVTAIIIPKNNLTIRAIQQKDFQHYVFMFPLLSKVMNLCRDYTYVVGVNEPVHVFFETKKPHQIW